jgi:DNA-directed RNA polymerase subunit RPC12/RpoP
MKRQTIKPIEFVGRIFPIFSWYKCCLCKEEFRRERGHWALIYNRQYYLCRECGGDSKLDGIQGFMEWEKRRKENRPSPPGPPPKPQLAEIRVIKEGSRYPKG